MQILIKAITSEPVMSAPRFDRPFIVKTDAANKEGLGGVLSQHDDDGREKVVAYHGRRLNKHERNYTVTEIELLAAAEAQTVAAAQLAGPSTTQQQATTQQAAGKGAAVFGLAPSAATARVFKQPAPLRREGGEEEAPPRAKPPNR
eukprot:scaffold101218_cov31-Phaeocystis_antarctica.AAC.1